MTERLNVISERVDDIPVLQAQMQQMGLPSLLDEHFPTHGNWQGLSLGWAVTIWLTYILSQGDHRLNHVEPWVEKRLRTLRRSTGQKVQVLDFTDDRLEIILYTLSDDDSWGAFESALSGHLLRVYDLNPERVRLDSTSASGYWTVTEDGLFQFGHSKDHRPDLPQVKVMLATLDPLGLAVATDVVSGERADDPLYIPSIKRVRAGLERRGLLYVGDCKMAALETRSFVQAGGDFYLCPLSVVQLPAEELETYLRPIWAEQQPLTPIYWENQESSERRLIAEGYDRLASLTAVVDGETITWVERRLVVRSLQQAQAAEKALRARLAKAEAAVKSLNKRGRGKKHFTEVTSLRQAAEAILERYKVRGLLRLSYEERVERQSVRRYGERPSTVREKRQITVTVAVDEEALTAVVQRLGWRVYVTNQPGQQLSLEQAVLAYRGEYIIEHSIGRLKGRPLSLTPMYLQRDDHATGLVRLLSIGLRVLTLLEFVVRRRLSAEKARLSGLYAGNPKRATARPTAERLLEAFREITLTIIQEAHQTRCHLTPLSELQKRILELLSFPTDIYTRLCTNSAEPP
jgi:transposase